MAKEVTRYIKKEVERELWARAAGRCEFNGCNRLLYKSPITQESVNISEKPHIYSFSKDGPRGWGPFKKNPKSLNDIGNLMLMCHDCHKTIDQDLSGKKYSAAILKKWKKDHEKRIEIVTGISPTKQSHVVLFGANIGDENSPLNFDDCAASMFPHRYPVSQSSIDLSLRSSLEDKNTAYWNAEAENLRISFDKHIYPIIKENNNSNFVLFALAPQPLLIYLGTLFTDKVNVNSYQLHREPKTWVWQNDQHDDFEFIVNEPESFQHEPALVLSISDKIDFGRIINVCGDKVSIWEVTVNNPNNDIIRSEAQLSSFRKVIRKLMVDIKNKHGFSIPLKIFPAIPITCAIEMGRVRMPKADMPWIIYDQNHKEQKFIHSLNIPRE